MRIFLMVLLILAAIGGHIMGAQIMVNAENAIHEIEALIWFLIGTVAMAGLAVQIGVEKLIEAKK